MCKKRILGVIRLGICTFATSSWVTNHGPVRTQRDHSFDAETEQLRYQEPKGIPRGCVRLWPPTTDTSPSCANTTSANGTRLPRTATMNVRTTHPSRRSFAVVLAVLRY